MGKAGKNPLGESNISRALTPGREPGKGIEKGAPPPEEEPPHRLPYSKSISKVPPEGP